MKLRPPFSFFKNKPPHNSQLERRLEKRHLSHFSATMSQNNLDTQECIATVLNFSKSGLAILSTQAIPTGETLTIQLAFNSERNVEVLLKVTSCREVETGFIIGCQLAEPNTHYESLVHKIIQPRHSEWSVTVGKPLSSLIQLKLIIYCKLIAILIICSFTPPLFLCNRSGKKIAVLRYTTNLIC